MRHAQIHVTFTIPVRRSNPQKYISWNICQRLNAANMVRGQGYSTFMSVSQMLTQRWENCEIH